MNKQIARIKESIEPLRQEIINHKVYSAIKNIEDLRVFMQYHVYAVWDFMSLLKSLQNNLTCTAVPWFPHGSADTRFLINEIVVGEESDVDLDGNRTSHFELYLAAMKQCGADTSKIEKFIEVDGGHHSHLALQMTDNLCQHNEHFWHEAELAITQSLTQRIELWNGVYRQLTGVKTIIEKGSRQVNSSTIY